MRIRGAEAEAKWRGLISEQVASGKTVSGFCRERGVAASQIFAWKRRLGQQTATGFIAVKRVAAEPAGSESGGGIELRLGRGRVLVIERGFDAGHLRALLAVLETES